MTHRSFHHFSTAAVGLLTASVLSGCAGAQIDALRKDLQSEITELRGIQAEHTASLNELRSELRSITGKVEEVQYVSQGKTQELEKTIKQLGSRVPPPAGVPAELLDADDAKISGINGAAADAFRSALTSLRAGDFNSARDGFKSFADSNPGTAFTDNALFWLGITYLRMSENDQAVVAFSDVYRSYPAEDMVPPSLYYLGDTLAKLGQTNDAQLTFEKLAEQFPRSEFAAMARSRLPGRRGAAAPAGKPKKK